MNKYSKWIKENVPADCRGMCLEFTTKMLGKFPELKRVRGHYVDIDGYTHEHWWLIDELNNIVDPTASQFVCKGTFGIYKPWDESKKEPTGECPNCGECCYDGEFFCNDKCEKEYMKDINARF